MNTYTEQAWLNEGEPGAIPIDKVNLNYIEAGIESMEGDLGLPSTDGYVLSSTAAGVRSWIAVGGGTPGVPVKTYDFYSTDLSGTTPPTLPPGPRDTQYGPDGTSTGTPDENGPWYFSIASGSLGKSATVSVDGFTLPGNEYTILDTYLKLLSDVSENSWVNIKI